MKQPVRWSDVMNNLKGGTTTTAITDEFIFTSCPQCSEKQHLKDAKIAAEPVGTVYRCKNCDEPICRILTKGRVGQFELQVLSKDGIQVMVPPEPGKAMSN